MYRLVYALIHLLAFFILSHARHTVFISHDGAKTYLPSTSEPDVCMTPTCVIAAADVLTSLDEAVDPCDDFYSFACGGWIKRQEVSDSQPEISTFLSTQKDLDRKLRDLLESELKKSEPSFVKMLKDFYSTCMDLDTLEKEGSEPLKKLLLRLGGWPVVEGNEWDEAMFDWVDTLLSFRKLGYKYEVLLNLQITIDSQNKTALLLGRPYLEELSNANLTLGLDDPKTAAYYRMMVKAAKLLGADESAAEKELLDALNFEIANIKIMSLYDRYGGLEKKRDKTESSIAELQKELPQVPWMKMINGLLLDKKIYENDTIINENPDFLIKFVDLITSTDKRVIGNYLLWKAVLQSKEHLSKEWKDLSKELKDIEEKDEEETSSVEKPRWMECLSILKSNMELGLSSYYVRHYFSDESKDEATEMMKYIHKEFLKLLKDNDWMDEKTRKTAEEKANAIKSYIGYPDELMNDTFMMKKYEKLTITTDSHLENMLMLHKLTTDKEFSVLRKSLSELMQQISKYMSLVNVNAFYNPMENSIAIPAGILHDTFYDKERPNYMNFAEIGYVIGHEITHGFDNQGRRYDKDGKQINWWDKESDEHFNKKAKCIIDQYDNYTMDYGFKLNGEKTQNEDIADNGGLKEAYLAYLSWTKDHGVEPLLPGVNFNQNQIFWLSAAHVWCAKYEPDTLKELILVDVHSPGKFRIIGPMSNLPEFSKDFNCSPDAPMNRKYKCEVW